MRDILKCLDVDDVLVFQSKTVITLADLMVDIDSSKLR